MKRRKISEKLNELFLSIFTAENMGQLRKLDPLFGVSGKSQIKLMRDGSGIDELIKNERVMGLEIMHLKVL